MDIDWRAEERIPIRRMLTPADVFSLSNALLGFLAIITALNGQPLATYTFILLAVLFDGFDGQLSRMGHGGGRLGGKLDSMADLITFCVAPAILLYSQYSQKLWFNAPANINDHLAGAAIVIAIAGLFFVMGLLRLARFDYLKGGERDDYFLGMTTPGAACILASVVVLGWEPVPALGVAAACALMMGSRLRLPKARGLLAQASGLVLVTAAALGDRFNNFGPILLLAFSMAYLTLGPLYVRRHEETDEEPQPTF